ncbi:MAG: hypothetical protein E6K80_14360 [Candidatus Eisenbacteria bacterium]|uniref:Uncharacterized protein n=1 Tax=Eiseniibacteriota bacterium TaxID=2212470 RepID=A0A538TXC9_UNCEI|nr:MAG: hypothetical protein E6K80_14360 [Candidatus Eisenbacteria bacterium]
MSIARSSAGAVEWKIPALSWAGGTTAACSGTTESDRLGDPVAATPGAGARRVVSTAAGRFGGSRNRP